MRIRNSWTVLTHPQWPSVWGVVVFTVRVLVAEAESKNKEQPQNAGSCWCYFIDSKPGAVFLLTSRQFVFLWTEQPDRSRWRRNLKMPYLLEMLPLVLWLWMNLITRSNPYLEALRDRVSGSGLYWRFPKPEKCVLVFVRSGCDGSPHSSSALEVISVRQLTHLLVQHFGSEWNVSITVGWITTDCVPAWVLLYLLYSEPWTALTIVLFAFYYYY